MLQNAKKKKKKISIFIHSLRPLVPVAYIINTAICRSIWTHGTWSPGKWVSCPGWLWTWTYCCGAWSRLLRWGGESDQQPPDPRSDNSRQTETCLNCTDGSSDSRCSEWPVGDHGHTHICIIVHCICDHLYAILYYGLHVNILCLDLHIHQMSLYLSDVLKYDAYWAQHH